MEKLAEALGMDVAGVARAVGVTTGTVKAWIAGARKPAERNRIKLARLVRAAQQENSAAGHRFSTRLDIQLRDLRTALMSADEKRIWEANRAKMQQQFAPAIPAQGKPLSALGQMKADFAAANAAYAANQAGRLF
jgi:hypothetical protein